MQHVAIFIIDSKICNAPVLERIYSKFAVIEKQPMRQSHHPPLIMGFSSHAMVYVPNGTLFPI